MGYKRAYQPAYPQLQRGCQKFKAFTLFDRGYRPQDCYRKVRVKKQTLYDYYNQWKRLKADSAEKEELASRNATVKEGAEANVKAKRLTLEAPDLLTYDEAATLLGISRPSIYNRIREGKLHPLKKGRGRLLLLNEVKQLWSKSGGTARRNSTGSQD